MNRYRVLSGLLVASLTGITLSADVVLVRDGRPMADIILAHESQPGVRLAAQDLQKHLELISGAQLPIVEAPSDTFENHVYVGPGKHVTQLGVTVDDLPVGEFRIIARDRNLFLLGHDEQREAPPFARDADSKRRWQEFAGARFTWAGATTQFNEQLGIYHDEATATLFAVSEFLEQLGVRWYSPYEDGTVVPRSATVIVPEQDLHRAPAVAYRHFNYYTMRNDAEGVLWFKRLKYGVPYGLMYGHTTGDVLGWGEQKEEHPEYFARVDGQLLNVPRLSDPGFRKASMVFLGKTVEAWPWLRYLNLAPTDGFTRIDERDAHWNRPEQGRTGRLSDYVWDYWLAMAAELKKRHPDRYLRCNSYAPYADTPSQVEKLPDNIAICIVINSATSFLNQEASDQLRDQWSSIMTSGKLFVYDYRLYYRPQFPRYPVLFTRHLQREMRAFRDTGMFEGNFLEIWPETATKRVACPALTHLILYWQGKLFWDIDANRDELLDEYCQLYFGSGQAEMREFHELAEKIWMRPDTRSITRSGGFLSPDEVELFFDLLGRAKGKVEPDTVYARRIARLEVEMSPLKMQFANLRRTGPYMHAFTPERVYKFPHDFDADLNKPFWRGHSFYNWYPMRDPVTGIIPQKNSAEISFCMAKDGSAFIVGAVCREAHMDRLVTRASEPGDRAIFEDDSLELLIATPERSGLFRIVVNAAGTVWQEAHDPTLVERDTLPELWNPGIRTVFKHADDHWAVEIMIPMTDFGKLSPSVDYPWGINVGRHRRAGGESELYVIAPTGKPDMDDEARMGDLAMGDYSAKRFKESPPPAGFPGDFQAAGKLFADGDFEAAHANFLELAEAAPTPSARNMCLVRAAQALAGARNYADALTLVQNIADTPLSHKYRMEILNSAGEYKALTEEFADEDIAAWPESINYQGYRLRGEAWMRVGDKVRALADFERSAELAGSDSRAHKEALQRVQRLSK